MEQEFEKLIDIPPADQMGPAMRALNPQQQRFVCALAIFGGDQQAAYDWAGYKTSNERSRQASSSRLANSEKVVQAIQEESLRRINSATLVAVSTLVQLSSPIHNPDAKLRRQAAVDILDRTGFHGRSEHKIVIKDERTTQELVDFIRANAHLAGVSAETLLGDTARQVEHQPIIDAEFEEVTEGAAGLEDML